MFTLTMCNSYGMIHFTIYLFWGGGGGGGGGGQMQILHPDTVH